MPASATAPPVSRFHRGVGIGFLAVSALVAVGISVLFLALLSPARTASESRRQATRFAPVTSVRSPGHHK